MKSIDDSIKEEMTPRTIRHWGDDYHDFMPCLLDYIHGDGQCLMHLTPLATCPNYYLIRIDTNVGRLIDEDGDGIRDFVNELYEAVEDECGKHEDSESDWPALNDSCGSCWGRIA